MKNSARLALLLAVAFCTAGGAMDASADTNGSGQVSLNVPFDPEQQSYRATVPHGVTRITVSAPARHPAATVTVNGGAPDTPVSLAVGDNVITIVVTAEATRYQRTYTVTVTRQAAARSAGATLNDETPSEEDTHQNPQTAPSPSASLIDNVREWRDDPQHAGNKRHTDRWDRVLLALGETVSDATLTPMTAAEAQGYADRGWTRWVEVARALHDLEADAPDSGGQEPPPAAQEPPRQLHASLIADVQGWRNDPQHAGNKRHTDRWDRVLLAMGERVSDTTLTPMPASEAQGYADQGWTRWVGVAQALNAVVTGSSGDDTLSGTGAGELLAGLGGADSLYGLDGDDELRGGDGDDTYTGGAGTDRFVIFSGETGAKVITDFTTGDVIVLKGGGWPSVSDITAYVTAVGSVGYEYDLGGGLTLETTNNRSLRTEDFILEN